MPILLPESAPLRDLLLPTTTMPPVLHLLCEFAILYTIIESCRRRGLDPHAYLRDVLTRLPHLTNWQIKDITPEAWTKAQQRPPLQAAS